MTVRNHRQTVAQDRNVDTSHLGPLCRSVVRHRHIIHFFAGFFGTSQISVIVRFSRLSSASSVSTAGLLRAEAGLPAISAVDMSLPAARYCTNF